METDKPPADCRYDQLEVTTPYELKRFSGRRQIRTREALQR